MAAKADVHVPFGSSAGQILPKALTSAARLIPYVIAIPIAGGAAGNTDFTVDKTIRVIEAWAVQGGAGEASDTIRLYNGANPITNAMAWSAVDQTVVRAGTIDDAQHRVAKGGTLRVTTVDADAQSDVAPGVVYVLAVPVP